jgi:hypothetical protein
MNMSKRHYIRTPNGDYKCAACRQEFSSRAELAKHFSIGGKCKHPITLGLTIDLSKNPYHWIRPENAPVRPSEAA